MWTELGCFDHSYVKQMKGTSTLVRPISFSNSMQLRHAPKLSDLPFSPKKLSQLKSFRKDGVYSPQVDHNMLPSPIRKNTKQRTFAGVVMKPLN